MIASAEWIISGLTVYAGLLVGAIALFRWLGHANLRRRT